MRFWDFFEKISKSHISKDFHQNQPKSCFLKFSRKCEKISKNPCFWGIKYFLICLTPNFVKSYLHTSEKTSKNHISRDFHQNRPKSCFLDFSRKCEKISKNPCFWAIEYFLIYLTPNFVKSYWHTSEKTSKNHISMDVHQNQPKSCFWTFLESAKKS